MLERIVVLINSIKLSTDMMTIHKNTYNEHTISSNALYIVGKRIKNRLIKCNRLYMFIMVHDATIMNIVCTLTSITFRRFVLNEYLSPELETNFVGKPIKRSLRKCNRLDGVYNKNVMIGRT